ncbi:MAG: sigma-70 family RNA polymerase sigma factor [Candidatus Aminicenantales bacterium]|jgi:RNA polymerase sigma-70 factor (ECF subfamily)
MELSELIKTRRFLEEISNSVHVAIYRRCPALSPGEREDLVQEVLLKIWKMADHGKKIVHLQSYLWKIVYTTALDIMEERMKEISLEEVMESSSSFTALTDELTDFAASMEREDLRRHLETVIDSLPENRRTVLKLHLTGMDLDETAEFLRWTHHKVRHLFYRGLADLRKRLQDGTSSHQKEAKLYAGGTHAGSKLFKKTVS